MARKPDAPRCAKDGCYKFTLGGEPHCAWHSTSALGRETRRTLTIAAASRGGHARVASLKRKRQLAKIRFPPPPTTIQEAKRNLAWIADQALREILHPSAANAATNTLKTWIAAEGYAKQIRELSDIIAKLRRADARTKSE